MRLLVTSLLILLALVAAASADIYRCRTPQGKLVYTNDPALFPVACTPEANGTSGSLNVVPLSTPAGTGQTSEELIRDATLRQELQQKQLAGWLDTANNIAAAFREARHQIYYTRRRHAGVIDAARQELAQSIQDKQALLQTMTVAGASRDEIRQVSQVLAEVAGP